MKVSALGSYPRIGEGPEKQRLRRAIQQFQSGKITSEELRAVADEVTREVIGEQESAGLDWVTDGLVRREDGQTYFTDRLEGFHRGGLLRYFDTNTYYRQPVTDGPVGWTSPITVADYQFAAKHSGKPVRPVVTGPFTLSRLSLDEHYKNHETLTDSLAEAMNQELRALDAAGAPELQIDEPVLTRVDEDNARIVEILERLTDGVKAPVWVALYMGPVISLVDRLASWPVSGVWLDCVTDAVAVEKLAATPFAESKTLGLGLMDARNTRLESVEEICVPLRRIAAKTDPERLAITTSAGLEFLPRDRAQKKLTRLAEAATAFKENG